MNLVANSAKATKFDSAVNPEKRDQTPRQIAVELCGSVNSAYFEAWRRINKPRADAIDLDVPILGEAYSLDWPACLYVSDVPGSYTVLNGDNLPKLYRIFTGSTGGQRSWSSFAAGTTLGPDNALKVGQQLTYHWSTRPVRLTLTIPRGDFEAQLDDAVAQVKTEDVRKQPVNDYTNKPIYANIPISAGEMFEDGGRVSYADAPECVGIDTPPFDAARVATTYRLVRERTKRVPNTTTMLVIDNGFFGARKVGQTLQFGSSFQDAEGLFLRDDPVGIIGPALKPGGNTIIYPLNYMNDLTQPDQRSGHGTHVLGLALGGPGFDRSLLKDWLSVSVIAVSKGKDELDGLSISDVITAVGTVKPRIVNMSVEYSKNQTSELLQLMERNPSTLFVVAAGNGYKSVEDQDSFPAMLADQAKAQNLLVVGATKGPGQPIADFSNFSEEKVGTAAPGCGIRSWIAESRDTVRMSGTSQAAPIVTFQSALVYSMMRADSPPEYVRYRIQVSGDPIDGDAKTQVQTIANIERALYLNFDYISYQPKVGGVVDLAAPPIELLGELTLVPTWKPCTNFPGSQTWSYAATPTTTGPSGISVITGFQENAVLPPRPCRRLTAGAGNGRLQFRAAWKLNGTDKPDELAETEANDIDIAQLNRFVRKGPGARPN